MTNLKDMTKKQREEYERKKRNEKIEKLKQSTEEKLKKRLEGIEEEYKIMYEKRIAEAKRYLDRKKHARINKTIKQYTNLKIDHEKKIRGHQKSNRIPTKIRDKAIAEFQKRTKLVRADEYGMVHLKDTLQKVHRSESVAGHVYPKSKYPHMIFILDNVRPITEKTNYLQADTVGHSWMNNIPAHNVEYLIAMSGDKESKNETRTGSRYRAIYEEYKAYNKELQDKLGSYYHKPKQ